MKKVSEHRPRIAFLIPRLGISDRGAEVFVYNLAKILSRFFSILIYVRKQTRSTSLYKELRSYNIEIKQISSPPATHPMLKWVDMLPFAKYRQAAHLHSTGVEMLLFSLLVLPDLLGRKVDILFPVNGWWGALVASVVRVLKRTPFVYASEGGIEPMVFRQKPDILFAVHPSTKDWVNANFPDQYVVYIPHGVDLKRYSPRGPKIQHLLPKPIYLTVSALVPEKQVYLTIRAMGKLKRGSLLVIGDGPLKDELTQLGLKLLGKERFVLESVDYISMPQYYRAADIFAFAAPWEVGWSNVHLEALATNLPLVVNHEPQVMSLVGDAGIACDVVRVEQYSQALLKASRTHFGRKPRLRVRSYSWENIGQQFRTHMTSLLK